MSCTSKSPNIMLSAYKVVFILLLSHIDWIKCEIDAADQGQLIFAHVLFRHGDRTPVDPYPNDPWKDRIYWPEGYGQLTNVGKLQHYELGRFFRKRYQSLLGNGTYLKDIVYIQSTDIDRTLMSAESNLAGLFPPAGREVWNENIKWQPIPIHTIPEPLDSVLAAKKHCPRYNYALKKYQETDEFKLLLNRFKPLFQYLEKNSGSPVTTFDQAQYLYNTLWIEELKKLPLPDWTKKVYVPGGDLEWVANHAFQISTNTTELARLKTGFLIREIVDRFAQKINSQLSPDRTLWMYSAHDTTVANVLNSLGLFYPHSPPYASSVLFELYKFNDSHYIKIFYKNTTNDLSPMVIPGCGAKCLLEDFRRIYASVIPTEDFEKECELSLLSMSYEDVDFHGVDGSLIALVCLALTLLFIVIISWKMFRHERDMRWYNRI